MLWTRDYQCILTVAKLAPDSRYDPELVEAIVKSEDVMCIYDAIATLPDGRYTPDLIYALVDSGDDSSIISMLNYIDGRRLTFDVVEEILEYDPNLASDLLCIRGCQFSDMITDFIIATYSNYEIALLVERLPADLITPKLLERYNPLEGGE